MTLQRINISRGDIRHVVSVFYSRVRCDAELGPVFSAHVSDWPAHEEKITCFWANAILRERAYDGNPMQIHLAAGNVSPRHFPKWLGLFDEVLAAELPADLAQGWSALAHRIGRSLSMGLEMAEQKTSDKASKLPNTGFTLPKFS